MRRKLQADLERATVFGFSVTSHLQRCFCCASLYLSSRHSRARELPSHYQLSTAFFLPLHPAAYYSDRKGFSGCSYIKVVPLRKLSKKRVVLPEGAKDGSKA
jgi:hypothetical protein